MCIHVIVKTIQSLRGFFLYVFYISVLIGGWDYFDSKPQIKTNKFKLNATSITSMVSCLLLGFCDVSTVSSINYMLMLNLSSLHD